MIISNQFHYIMNNYFKVGPERNEVDSNKITVINKILRNSPLCPEISFGIFRSTQEKTDDDSFVPPLPDYEPSLPPVGFTN